MDPRALANLILDIADAEGIGVTNLALNKVAYFAHALYLAEQGHPLVDAKIEAWQYGPVFREIYHQFKSFDKSAIRSRAKVFDPEIEEYTSCRYDIEQKEYEYIRSITLPYLKMRPGKLVDLSHEPGGPWHKAWFHDGEVNPGMEITDAAIEAHFSRQVRH
ncbi:DUF4065 domain-containing protein [Novosphingobium sp. G106]|uniref:Panacea domain-containing protein n=1 Tax=Novosphingobium sp. G106 TaxID=2849500 RepID=UPI001C2CDDA5|nr:type II toxin-antitoxin system antitoxin SocA domain-containing protein [Novosphingobium sp. G106]MBV1690107.1 DUF4065 domain-containing protein [Novosphingobium sp. G106]